MTIEDRIKEYTHKRNYITVLSADEMDIMKHFNGGILYRDESGGLRVVYKNIETPLPANLFKFLTFGYWELY